MNNPDVIATLFASKLALPGFALPHNARRYQPGSPVVTRISSRESTPSSDEDDPSSREHSIVLRFSQPPKNIGAGFVFGLSPECDIVLDTDDPSTRHASQKHFSITFNADGHLILRDHSSVGTCVNYGKDRKNQARREATWVLFPDCDNQVTIPGTIVSIRVVLGTHRTCQEAYYRNISVMLRAIQQAGGGSGHASTSATAPPASSRQSGTRSSVQAPILRKLSLLGQGGFGRVHKVADVSTGKIYACKTFFHRGLSVEREIKAMSAIKHQHIVGLVHATQSPNAQIIMEYCPLGNLEDLDKASRITWDETMQTLIQGLHALAYLHGLRYAHRDIKPENILVASRKPLHIKLADFGLAKEELTDESGLNTVCGTELYVAPELSSEDRYTNAVDIWSLGVVILQYAHGLPRLRSAKINAQWHRDLEERALEFRNVQPARMLSMYMLRIRPEQRELAGVCLREAIAAYERR